MSTLFYICTFLLQDWQKRLQLKIPYYECIAVLYMGNQSEEQQKWGERVAFYQSALDKLNEALKLSKGEGDTVQEAMRFTMDVVGGK